MKTELVGIERLRRNLSMAEREVFPKASARALNTAAMQVRTKTVRAVAKAMGIKQKPVRSRTKLRKATPKRLNASLSMRGRALNWIEFKAREVRRGVSAAPWGKRRTMPGAFIATVRGNRLVLVRQKVAGGRVGTGHTPESRQAQAIAAKQGPRKGHGQRHLPIEAMLGPGIAKTAASEEIQRERNAVVGEVYPRELRRQLDLLVARLPG